MDTIIAVKDVLASAEWYGKVFDCMNAHGGREFAVLKDKKGAVLICLHLWGEHEHPTMQNVSTIPGNGLILYFRTAELNIIRQNVEKMNYQVEIEVHYNENSKHQEFAIKDLDGYYIIVSEYHEYVG